MPNIGSAGTEKTGARISWSTSVLIVFLIFLVFNTWQSVHERWVVDPATGEYNAHIAFYGLAVLGLLFLGWFLYDYTTGKKVIWKVLTSVRFGVVLMSALTIGTILGTLVFQKSTPQEYIAFYSSAIYFLIKALHLNHVFFAWWFLALEALLALSLTLVIIRQLPLKLTKLGAPIVHVGIILVLIGAAVGALWSFDGALYIGEGESSMYAAEKGFANRLRGSSQTTDHTSIPVEYRVPLGVEVTLDKFEELYYENPYILMINKEISRKDIMTGEIERVNVAGLELKYDDRKPARIKGEKETVRILNFFENFRREQVLEDAEDGVPMATIALEPKADAEIALPGDREFVLAENTPSQRLIALADKMIPAPSNTSKTEVPPYAAELFYFATEPDADTLSAKGITQSNGEFFIMASVMREGRNHLSQYLSLGETSELEDTGFSMTILRFLPDARVELDDLGNQVVVNGSGLLRNPAVEVELTGNGLETPIRFFISQRENLPATEEYSRFAAESNMIFGMIYIPDTKLVLAGDVGMLQVYRKGVLETSVNLNDGGYALPMVGYEITLVDSKPKAVVKENLTNDNPVNNYAIEIEVTYEDGSTRTGTVELYDENLPREQVMQNLDRYFFDLHDETVMLQRLLYRTMQDPLQVTCEEFLPKLEEIEQNAAMMFNESEQTMLQKIIRDVKAAPKLLAIDLYPRLSASLMVRSDYIKDWQSHVTVRPIVEETVEIAGKDLDNYKHTLKLSRDEIHNINGIDAVLDGKLPLRMGNYKIEVNDAGAVTLELNAVSSFVDDQENAEAKHTLKLTYAENRAIQEHSVRVNSPLVSNGFYYYQVDWYPKAAYGQVVDQWFTFLDIVYDPGLWLVYIGVTIMILGMLYAFYIQPYLRRKRGIDPMLSEKEE